MNAAKEKAPTRQRQGFGVNHYEAIHMANPTILNPVVTSVRSSNVAGSELLAVIAGVPVLDTMEHASTLLDTALKSARDLAMEGDDHKPWAVVYLLENTLALVNASVNGMLGAKQ